MGTGATVYNETPWGLFSQQQLLLMTILLYAVLEGLDPGDVPPIVAALQDFYDVAWPLVEEMDL